MTAEPLDLRDVFARPWAGPAVTRLPWWLRWVPFLPTRFHFRTEVTSQGDTVVVLDTQTFPNGRVWRRTMHGQFIAPDRWRMSAEDMPGGAEITVGADGYRFTPYLIRVPLLGPLTVRLRCEDEVRFDTDGALWDTIEFRFLGIRVGILTMHLRRESD